MKVPPQPHAAQAPHEDETVAAALDVVRLAVGVRAAACFRSLVAMPFGASMDIGEFARISGIEGDDSAILDTLRATDAEFGDVFGCRMFHDVLGRKAKDEGVWQLTMSRPFADLIAWKVHRPDGRTAPQPDDDTLRWIEIARSAANDRRGHHIALRARVEDRRSVADFADMCAATGARTAYIAVEHGTEAAILGAELYGPGLVVVVDGSRLVTTEGDDGLETSGDEALTAPDTPLEATAFASRARGWLAKLTNVYVWKIPATGRLPQFLTPLVGGCIETVRFDPAWTATALRVLAPDLGVKGIRALTALSPDPRDARAIVGLATAAGAAAGTTLDEACAVLIGSLGSRKAETSATDTFDPQLVPEGDCADLFARAAALREGGRVLLHGPPGGGKSAMAKALAHRIDPAQRAVLPIMPAHFLMKGWGAMERRLHKVITDAAATGAIVVADELGSLCPTRDPDPQRHGNAALAQALTDEWLRLLDAYPRLVLIATVNNVSSVDPAIQRRFQICVYVPSDLDPKRERAAWTSVLGMEPPPDWQPAGAAVADFTSAAERCRLLGRLDPSSLAEAIRAARDLRTGRITGERQPTKNRLLN